MSNLSGLVDPFLMPGMGDPSESSENEFYWGLDRLQLFPISIVSTALDSTNTPTTTLRRGLIMGQITATKKWKEYDPTATDGSQVPVGPLYQGRNLYNYAAAATADHWGQVLLSGNLKVANLYGFDENARRFLQNRFNFDDLRQVVPRVQLKAADYTVLATDNGSTFSTRGASGAVNFTLPTLDRGLEFTFVNEVNQDMTITAGTADTLVTFNDLAADTVAFSTSGEKIGACVRVVANDNETKWLVQKLCSNTMTITT